MKTFWIAILVFIITVIGALAISLGPSQKPGIMLLLCIFGSMLITFPAMNWWIKYFKDLFNN